MIKRKLQVVLFGALLAFSAAAQGQTAAINNPVLTRLAQAYASAYFSGGFFSSATQVQYREILSGANVSALSSGGSLIVNGVPEEVRSVSDLLTALGNLARQPGFDPRTTSIIVAASPNS